MQITPVLLIEWKLWGQLLPNAGVKLAFEPNAQILKMYVGKLAFARWWYWRDGDAPYPYMKPWTVTTFTFHMLLLPASVACLCFRVFRKKPTPLRTYSTRTRMHLKETRKFSISACLQVASGKQAPTDLTNGFASACACVCGPYGNISGHIMHFIAIEKNMFMCRSERKDLDIVCASRFGR